MGDSSDSTLRQSVRRMFVTWLLLSTAAIFAVALVSGVRASAADVFIDEGEGDYDKPTPVEAPISGAGSDVGTGSDSESHFNASNADSLELSPIIDPVHQVVDTETELPRATEAATPTIAKVKAVVKASVKRADKGKKKSVKSSAKAAKKAAVVKSNKKISKANSNRSKASKKTAKRKVASVIKYAGGQYLSTSRECSMESAPGAGDTIGTAKAQRKLWVEDAADSGYWKVYSKSGQAAFLSRSCF